MIHKIFFVFLLATSMFAKDNITLYNSFANANHLIIEGRMLYKKANKKVEKDDGKLTNLWRKLTQLTNDEIKNNLIFATLDGEKYITFGDDEGYFRFEIESKKALLPPYQDVLLNIEDNKLSKHIKVPIFMQKAVGIISDFDDTVVISDVTDKLKLSNNLLLKNYKQRTLIPTMRERFQKILSKNPKNMPTPLFFVTGSPQQFFNSIEEFLNYHDFGEHILITKQLHGKEKDSILDQFSYKTKHIEELIEFYPNLTWVLFGDSGEKDREIYSYLAKKYPSKIEAIYIRDVESKKIKRVETSQ
jgi:phosphatidate phosphatase APP1